MSPPGATFPPDVELPHVPAPGGQSGVPQGEGCYECDNVKDQNNIPLSRPLSLRQKRSLQNITKVGNVPFIEARIPSVPQPGSCIPISFSSLVF